MWGCIYLDQLERRISQENRAPSVAMHEMQEDKVADWEAGRANQKAEG